MANLEVAVLNNQRPTHKASLMVVHSGEEHQRIVICEDLNGLYTWLKINLKMFLGEQQSKSFLFNGGILKLMFVKLAWKVTHRMINALIVLLQKDSSSPNCTGINFKFKRKGKMWGRQNRRATQYTLKVLKRVLALTGPNKRLWGTALSSQWGCYRGEVFAEPATESSHPKKTAQLSSGGWYM